MLNKKRRLHFVQSYLHYVSMPSSWKTNRIAFVLFYRCCIAWQKPSVLKHLVKHCTQLPQLRTAVVGSVWEPVFVGSVLSTGIAKQGE